MLYGPNDKPLGTSEARILGPDGAPVFIERATEVPERETTAPVPVRIEVATAPRNDQTEVVRSFSYKLNMQHYGGHQYESADFFCSQRVYCDESDKFDASLAAYSFCRGEVMRDVKDAIDSVKRKQAAREMRRTG